MLSPTGSLLPPFRGIYLCGHSAGAHLAAMVLSTDWTEFQVVPDIKGSVAMSQNRVWRRTGLHTWDKAAGLWSPS